MIDADASSTPKEGSLVHIGQIGLFKQSGYLYKGVKLILHPANEPID
jgi:hypothetical protein